MSSLLLRRVWLEYIWDFNFLPLSNESDSSSLVKSELDYTERTSEKRDYKVLVEFFKIDFFFFFLNFHPISLSSVHSLVNNSGKPQAAKSDPCIFSETEGI